MEKRIKAKVDQHQLDFKKKIHEWVNENKLFIDKESESNFLKYLYDYDNVLITKTDLQKRKRSKNIIPQYDRCNACRANGEQCTRRKRESEMFCGTHIKGTPNGVLNSDKNTTPVTNKKITVWYEDIMGIQYYIDEMGNVYKPEDIMSNKQKPDIIGQWIKNEKGEYTIPNLSINV